MRIWINRNLTDSGMIILDNPSHTKIQICCILRSNNIAINIFLTEDIYESGLKYKNIGIE